MRPKRGELNFNTNKELSDFQRQCALPVAESHTPSFLDVLRHHDRILALVAA